MHYFIRLIDANNIDFIRISINYECFRFIKVIILKENMRRLYIYSTDIKEYVKYQLLNIFCHKIIVFIELAFI